MGITDKGAQPDELEKKSLSDQTQSHLPEALGTNTTKDKTWLLTLWHPNTYRWYICTNVKRR